MEQELSHEDFLEIIGMDFSILAHLDLGGRLLPISESERRRGLLMRGPILIESTDSTRSEIVFNFHVRLDNSERPAVVVEYQWLRHIDNDRSYEARLSLPLFTKSDKGFGFGGENGEIVLIRPLTLEATSRHLYFDRTAETVEQFVSWFWFEQIARSLPGYPMQILDLAADIDPLLET